MAFKSTSALLALALLAILATNECLAAPLGAAVTTGSASRGLTMEKYWCEYSGKRYWSWKGYSREREYYWDREHGWCCYDWKSRRGYWSKSKCSS
jgi:hypothetical protein